MAKYICSDEIFNGQLESSANSIITIKVQFNRPQHANFKIQDLTNYEREH